MSDDTTFYNAVAAFRAAKARADDIRKPVVVLYELQPYEDANGGQGTRFVRVARGDTMSQLIKCVEDDDRTYKKTSVFLAVHRLLSAAGDYYTEDGTLAIEPPTEGLLRDSIVRWDGKARPANDGWIPVENVRGGFESEPASAVAAPPTGGGPPPGWETCRDKYGIHVVFTLTDD